MSATIAETHDDAMSSDYTIRVRQLLSVLNGTERAQLKKLLPKGVATHPPAEPDGTRYPAALLSALPDGESYSLAGWITEDLLRLPPIRITTDALCTVARARCPDLTDAALAKVLKSKTTEPYLEHIRQTRIKVRNAAVGPLRYEEEVGAPGPIRGHPDARTETQLFEVKMTGQLKQNWVDFLFQVFAYAALTPAATHVYLVLPLQEILWSHDVATAWPNRTAFRAFLETVADKKRSNTAAANLLLAAHCIGSHMPKVRTLTDTIRALPTDRPSQIFLGGPQSTRMNVTDADIATAAAAITETGIQLFIHSQYIINLCRPATDPEDAFHTDLLRANLRIATAIGARGVVVHVGKYTTQEPAAAVATMRTNILSVLDAATPQTPLLLETPAGQGTETLRTWEEFAGFVASIADPRLRICVDTCHVFACGAADPLEYVQRLIDTHPGILQLIHFNDSATACGSCLDRHAFCGEGHIGLPTMTEIATVATAAAIPMVVE